MLFFFSQASRILGIPPILTEQYPKGLGPTVPELGAADLTAHAKTSFTMMIEEVQRQLEALGNPKQAILCGIEAHACIAVRAYFSLDNETINVVLIREQVKNSSSILCQCKFLIDLYNLMCVRACAYVIFYGKCCSYS